MHIFWVKNSAPKGSAWKNSYTWDMYKDNIIAGLFVIAKKREHLIVTQ